MEKGLTLSREGQGSMMMTTTTITIGSVQGVAVRSWIKLVQSLLGVIGNMEARLGDIIKEDGDGGSRDLAA